MFYGLLTQDVVDGGSTQVPFAPYIIIGAIIGIALLAIGIYLLILLIKALKKYINSSSIREEKAIVRKTLGETLKQYRVENNMTQEYVAEALGVSRQAVSKWEKGLSDPSTSNLLAIAKLYDVSAEELLKNTTNQK